MLGIGLKLFSMIFPFLKEVLMGNKKIKKQDRKINGFLMLVSTFLFLMLMVSNLTNGKLNSRLDESKKKIALLQEENMKLSAAGIKTTEELTQCKIVLNEDDAAIDSLYAKIEELESIDCDVEINSLAHKLSNLEDGVCDLLKLNLKSDMPPVPKISRLNSSNEYAEGVMLDYIKDLRDYIKISDLFIEKQKGSCK